MKQKYILTRGEEQDTLTISEYTELENDVLSLICEESHDGAAIRSAIDRGVEALISTFRTHNMYPRMTYAEKIAEGIIELYETEDEKSMELIFDDKDAFQKPGDETAAVLEMIKTESATISSLIGGDDEEDEDQDSDDGQSDDSDLQDEQDDDSAKDSDADNR